MTMGMVGRVPARRRLLNQVSQISERGPYYVTDAGGRADRVQRRTGMGQTAPLIPGFPLPGLPPPSTGIPGIDQFLQGMGQMLGSTIPPAPTLPGVPGLPNFRLPAGISDLLYMMPIAGMFTPWAGQVSDFQWEEVSNPTANVAVMELTQVMQALELSAVGRPGFVAFLSEKPTPTARVSAAFVGTPYQYADTQAVYSQQDTKSPPKMMFLHWASLRDPADPNGGSGGLEISAQSIAAKPVFALPVDRTSTTTRQPPGKGQFVQAYRAQFGEEPYVEPGRTLPQPDPTQPPGKPPPTMPSIPTAPTPGTIEPGQPSSPGAMKLGSGSSDALLWGGAALVAGFAAVVLFRGRR